MSSEPGTGPGWLTDALAACGLLAPGTAPTDAEPLAGGVSSDVWRVRLGDRQVCVKRALPRLRVAARWEAPVSRSASEAAWLARAGRIDPAGVPGLLGADPGTGAIVLEWLDPDRHRLWKGELLAGVVDPHAAPALGGRLARWHVGMAADPEAPSVFANAALFEALRLAPYFRSTAEVHPALSRPLAALCDSFATGAVSVVHGDVSPKNVLLGPDGPVLLDAECACWGDPAFDVAFLLTHLLLKSRHRPADAGALHDGAAAFWAAYTSAGGDAGLEASVARWWAALVLARLDGRSPVEYLDDDVRSSIRADVLPLVADPPARLADLDPLWRIPA